MKKRWLSLGLVVLLAMAGGFAGGVFLAWRSEFRALSAARLAVQEQMSAIQHEDFARAYQFASFHVKQKLTPGAFETALRFQCQRLIQDATLQFGEVAWTADGSLCVEAFFHHNDGTISPAVFLLLPEEADWKVQSFEIGSPRRDGEKPAPLAI